MIDHPDTKVDGLGPAMREREPATGAVSVAVIEEEALVGKRQVDSGRVRVTTHTDLVEEHFPQSLRTDEVEVTRVPVNRTLGAGEAIPAIRTEGSVTIVPVIEEIAIVERRFVIRDELHIRRETRTDEIDVPVTLRKQRAVVERSSPAEAGDEQKG